MNEQASAWLGAVDGLPQVHRRLRRVMILNRDALTLIRQLDKAGTLFYCDPPYVPTSRTAPSVYAHEFTTDQHRELLRVLRSCRGKVMLSGYPTDLYDGELADWHRREIDQPNHAAGGRHKRRVTEVVWMNFEPGGE
jgi:DNA adenine methylase